MINILLKLLVQKLSSLYAKKYIANTGNIGPYQMKILGLSFTQSSPALCDLQHHIFLHKLPFIIYLKLVWWIYRFV